MAIYLIESYLWCCLIFFLKSLNHTTLYPYVNLPHNLLRCTEMTFFRNWTHYNKLLVNRGNTTFLFSDEVFKLGNHKNEGCRRGHTFVCCDTPIETLLNVHEVFHLIYRSSEGIGMKLR